MDHVIAAVNNSGQLPEFQEEGIRALIPGMVRSALLALIAKTPAFFTLLVSGTDGYQVREIVLENPLFANRALMNIPLGGEMLLLAVNRGNDILIPHGSTVLQTGDRLTLLGQAGVLADVSSLLEKV